MKFTFNTSSNTITYDSSSTNFNTYILALNGPYQGANWKLLANNRDNFLTIYNKKNNILQIADIGLIKDKTYIDSNNNLQTVETFYDKSYSGSILSFKEPPVEYNFPIRHILNVSNSPEDIEILSSYENQKNNFANKNLETSLKIDNFEEKTVYDKLKDPISGVEIKETEYNKYIFPKKEYVGTKKTRTKPNYEEVSGYGSNGYDRNAAQIRSFWKDSKKARSRTWPYAYYVDGPINSLNYLDNRFQKVINETSQVSILSTANITPLTLDVTSYYNSSSIWVMDNDYVFTSSSPSLPTASFSGSFTGDLAPYKEHELRYFCILPTGSYSYDTIQLNNYNLNIYKFAYKEKTTYGERYLPKPQFIFINHRPSEYFYGSTTQFPYTTILLGTYYINNSGMSYKTDVLSGKKPLYDSYEDFFSDLRPLSKKYSIIPEFKISDFIEFYLNKQDPLFLSPITSNYLSTTGFDVSYSDSYETNLFDKFIINEKQQNKIKISVNAALKLLPYKGFYPQDRSVQIVDLFRKSFFDIATDKLRTGSIATHTRDDNKLGYNGVPIDQQTIALIQPLFAPGVLFNTIKAGVAVDWPCMIRNSVEYSSSTFPEFYTNASSTALSQSRSFYVLDGNFDYRMKFENILDINSMFPEALKEYSLYYLNPTFYSVDNISGSDREKIRFPLYNLKYSYSDYNSNFTQKNYLYNLGINNFVAEIPNFFLKNQKLNNFLSKPKEINVVSGTTYYMDVYLKRHPDCKQIVTQSINDSFTSTVGTFTIPSLKESEFYGPPSKYWNTASLAKEADFLDRNKANLLSIPNIGILSNPTASLSSLMDDPAFAPYAPPYYYGNSIARINYKPDFTGITTINEIVRNCSIDYLNPELESKFSASVINYNKQYTGSCAYTNRMNLDASVNFKQITDLKSLKTDQYGNPLELSDATDNSLNVWSIQTKFETPVLNFNNDLNKNNTSITNNKSYSFSQISVIGPPTTFLRTYSESNIFDVSTLGLWTGYGEIPNTGEGVVFGLKESFSDNIYLNSRTSASLAQLCGFEIGERDIGSIATKKEISEAVVLIPYIEKGYENFIENSKAKNILGIVGENGVTEQTKDAGPFYFSVEKEKINELLNSEFSDSSVSQLKKLLLKNNIPKNNSIIKCIKGMLEYNLPPQLDWVTNKSIDPFVMYFFEFKHNLDQEDLANIWQGLMPKISNTAKLENLIFEHPLNSTEFFHGKKLPENIKFKIFKVKKRSNINYYELTDNSSDDQRFKFEFANTNRTIPNYSYNWPYDFFSLVELVNVEAGAITISGSV